MKVYLTLKDWKSQNTDDTWNAIIRLIPPCYRSGYTHEVIGQAFFGGKPLVIDFGDSEDVTNKFISDIAVKCTNLFNIRKEK